jgi:hypothetical protein
MKIEHWLLIAYFLIVVAAFVFIRICYIQDKKQIKAEAERNKTVFFIEPKK